MGTSKASKSDMTKIQNPLHESPNSGIMIEEAQLYIPHLFQPTLIFRSESYGYGKFHFISDQIIYGYGQIRSEHRKPSEIIQLEVGPKLKSTCKFLWSIGISDSNLERHILETHIALNLYIPPVRNIPKIQDAYSRHKNLQKST